MTLATLAVDARCEVGEGVLWCERYQQLWWTDIQSARLWRHRPDDGATRSWALPDRLGSFALCESGRLLLGFVGELCMAGFADDADETLRLHRLAHVPRERAALRVNDGRADRSGNFVFGTLNEDPGRAPIGRFYQYSARHGLRPLDLGGFAIPNSLCFDLDGRGLYYCDTLQGDILHCAYDAVTAAVGRPRRFATIDAPGSPDGSVIDAQGRLWNAEWGAARVVCYGHDGRIAHEVRLPTPNASCLTFAGPGLDTIYVTTAWAGLDDEARATDPMAGGVFRASVDSAIGLPEARFDDT